MDGVHEHRPAGRDFHGSLLPAQVRSHRHRGLRPLLVGDRERDRPGLRRLPGGHVPGRHQSFVGDQDRRRRLSAGNQGQGTPRQRPVGRGVPLPDRCARWRTGPVLPQLPFAHAIPGAAQHRLVDALVNGVPQCRPARGCCAQCPGRDRGAKLGIPGRHPPVRPEFQYDPGRLVDWFGTQLLA
ncbi:hypothetical protein D3C81_1444330 [compost metagenome]